MPIYGAGGLIWSNWFQGCGIQKVDDTGALDNFSPKKKPKLLYYSNKRPPVKLTAQLGGFDIFFGFEIRRKVLWLVFPSPELKVWSHL